MLKRIEEPVVRRLGRHVQHDERSRAYRAATVAVRSIQHRHYGPVLDQGNLGSCTGNAVAQCLNTSPLAAKVPGRLTEDDAVEIYSLATKIDGFPGAYPPSDTGSSGLAAMKAAKRLGYIDGYSHTFSLDELLGALSLKPGILGIAWYDTFDQPRSTGECPLLSGAYVRGGHEVALVGIDDARKRVWCLNSWGAWGYRGSGRFWFSYATLAELLSDRGDATFPS